MRTLGMTVTLVGLILVVWAANVIVGGAGSDVLFAIRPVLYIGGALALLGVCLIAYGIDRRQTHKRTPPAE